jgi:site-specific recombinase XerD
MTSTDQSISPLRRRFIEDMTARRLGEKTQTAYVRAVKQLGDFLGRSPASADAEDLRRFQLHLVTSGVGSPTVNAMLTALRFFF